MLLPSKTAIELGVRCAMAYRDIHFAILSIYLRKLFPVAPIDPASAVKLMPGTALDGGPDIIEHFILCSLVKMIRPSTILELRTFRGGTTGHFYDNAPDDAVIYTLDLPDDERPVSSWNADYATVKVRPFLPNLSASARFSWTARNGTAFWIARFSSLLLIPIILTTGSATIRKELYPTRIRAPAFAGPIRSRATSASDHALSTGTGRTGMENFSYSWHARDLKLDHFYERRVARETKDSGAADRRLPLSGLCGALAFSDFARLVLVR
jgi:hypothetical protein